MRIDRPTCLYGEPNCRKRFDGNCTVENDFDTRCPIYRTFNEVLEVINKLNHNGSVSIKLLRKEIEALKGDKE